MKRSWGVPAAVTATAVAAVTGVVLLVQADGGSPAGVAADGSATADRGVPTSPSSPPPPSTSPSTSPSSTPPSAGAAARPAQGSRSGSCDPARRGVVPRRISVPGVVAAADVVTPARDANGVPGVPPLTDRGKSVFAWDREQGIRPGDPAGNVLLNAHTWPDGSALGNRMLADLRRGDRIVVVGGGRRLCYRVSERVEVLAADGLPRYYDTEGPPRLAIVVCSGRRLAPGVWEKRTVWFAAPVSGR